MTPQDRISFKARVEQVPHPTGFDVLRIGLAVAIVAWHTIVVCYGTDVEHPIWASPIRPLPFSVVPAFFALSGFLVAGSLERNDLPTFVSLRAIRIFPALAAEIFLSALILGVAFTSMPLGEYLTNHELLRYLANISGDIHYYLPGVFKTMPAQQVNIQLWTIPIELECYLALVLITAMGLLNRPRLFVLGLTLFALVHIPLQIMRGEVAPYPAAPHEAVPFLAFLFGVAFYRIRDIIPFSRLYFVVALFMTWFLFMRQSTELLAVLPLTYATIYFGLLNPPIGWLRELSNYSYGIYLYGFPVQQAVYATMPIARTPVWNLVASLPIITFIAMLSWYLLESRIMANRKAIQKQFGRALGGIENVLGAAMGQLAGRITLKH